MNTDAAIVLMLADRQRDIETLRARVAELEQETARLERENARLEQETARIRSDLTPA